MADAMVERRPTLRFFCHRCNIEFEDVLQDYTCPYCASGFIEQLENESVSQTTESFSDADMSQADDTSNTNNVTPPVFNDLALLMSGSRFLAGRRRPERRETLLEQLVWMIGGARPGSGAVTAGAPFVLVGAPGDYVFGGEGLDAVVTQLLGQLENSGPPPLPREEIAALPSETVTQEHITTHSSCSVCWENFQIGETISRLACEHIFHSGCIKPWLQLHATCPICRRSLLPDPPRADPPSADPPPASTGPPVPPRPPVTVGGTPTPDSLLSDRSASITPSGTTTSSTTSLRFSALWPDSLSQTRSHSHSTGSGSSSDTRYNMDIDYD